MLYGRQGDECFESNGCFGFCVTTEGKEELQTVIARHPVDQLGNHTDAPAQSRFDARRTERAMPGYDAFLCHSHADKHRVREIADQFKTHGISYWLDEEQIDLGDPVTQRIQAGLDNSRAIIVCISRSLVTSSWARTEYTSILARVCGSNPNSNRRAVIPLLFEDIAAHEYPSLLYDRLGADIRDQSSMQALLKRLKSASAKST
jgi:hypothetical protein